MPSSNWQRLISGHVQQATPAPSSDSNRRDKGRRSGWAGALCLSSLEDRGGRQDRYARQATPVKSSSSSRRDKGRRSGWAGALCLSSLGRREGEEDKHKAPTSAPHHPLSLQQ